MPTDIPLSDPSPTPADVNRLVDTLQRTDTTSSIHRTAFEEALAAATGRRHAVALASSEAALPALLHAMSLGRDRDLVIPALGDSATIRAARAAGLRPRFAECDPGTLVPTAEVVDVMIGESTACVLAAHGDGWGTGLPGIVAACGRHEVPLIELAGTRLGGRCAGAPVGSLGWAGVVDLSRRSIVSGGEGAAIVTDDEHLANACRGGDFIRSDAVFRADPMSEITAAIASLQLRRLDTIIEQCTDAAEQYTIRLSRIPELLLPASTPDAVANWARYVVRLDETFSEEDRDEIVRGMQRHDIQAAPGPSHLPTLSDASGDPCPVAASMAGRAISLPIHTSITLRDVDLICQTLHLMIQRAMMRRPEASSPSED